MSLVAFCGDIHGNIDKMYRLLLEWEARTDLTLDAVVSVGDFGIFENIGDFPEYWKGRSRAPISTYVIVGNHENYELIRRWQRDPLFVANIQLIPDGEAVDVTGIRVGGVWGNYSPRSWNDPKRVAFHRAGGNSNRIAAHIDKNACWKLCAAGYLNVLVTHDSAQATLPAEFRRPMDPALKQLLGLGKNEEAGGCPGFDTLLEKFQPPRYFFGHLHVRHDMQMGPTKVTCLQAIDYARGNGWFEVVDSESL